MLSITDSFIEGDCGILPDRLTPRGKAKSFAQLAQARICTHDADHFATLCMDLEVLPPTFRSISRRSSAVSVDSSVGCPVTPSGSSNDFLFAEKVRPAPTNKSAVRGPAPFGWEKPSEPPTAPSAKSLDPKSPTSSPSTNFVFPGTPLSSGVPKPKSAQKVRCPIVTPRGEEENEGDSPISCFSSPPLRVLQATTPKSPLSPISPLPTSTKGPSPPLCRSRTTSCVSTSAVAPVLKPFCEVRMKLSRHASDAACHPALVTPKSSAVATGGIMLMGTFV